MKIVGNIIFILAAIFIIIIAAYAGANKHEHCNECNKAYEQAQPSQFIVESGSYGIGYMISTW